jgi:hypothetical protein
VVAVFYAFLGLIHLFQSRRHDGAKDQGNSEAVPVLVTDTDDNTRAGAMNDHAA